MRNSTLPGLGQSISHRTSFMGGSPNGDKKKLPRTTVIAETELPPVVDIDDCLSNLYSNQVYDYLRVRTNPILIAFLKTQTTDADSLPEQIQFSDNVTKINRRNKKQPRQLVITNKALYNFKVDNYSKTLRKIPISHLRGLVLSLSSDEFVFKVQQEYDYRFIIKHRTEALQLIARFYEQAVASKIPITLSEQEDLKSHVVTKHPGKGEVSKQPRRSKEKVLPEDETKQDEAASASVKIIASTHKPINLNPEDWQCKKKGSTKKWDRKYLMLRGGFIEYYTPKIKGNVPLGAGVDVRVDEKVDSVLQSLLSAKGLMVGDKLPPKKVLNLLGIKTDFMRFRAEITSKTRKKALMIAAENKHTLDDWITAMKNETNEPTQHKEGWLMIKDATQNSWIRRYFVLVKKQDEEARCWMYEMVLKDKIDLRGGVSGHRAKVAPTEPKPRHEFAGVKSQSQFAYRWNISDSSRIFYMAADSPEVMQTWIDAVNAANRLYTRPGYEQIKDENEDALPEEVREAIEQEAPTGQVTFVFTDVQSSTTLWEKVPDAMDICLEMHDRILRQLLLQFKGYEVKTEGDAFMVTFFTTLDAVMWCLAVQEELVKADWLPDFLKMPVGKKEVVKGDDGEEIVVWNGIRIRMGIHTGKPNCRRNPVTGRMDYFGPVVNAAARISDSGHGGQIVVSKEVKEIIDKEMVEKANQTFQEMKAGIKDQGMHRLKGIQNELPLFTIHTPALVLREFPPLRSLTEEDMVQEEEEEEEEEFDEDSEEDGDGAEGEGQSEFEAQSVAEHPAGADHQMVSYSGAPEALLRASMMNPTDDPDQDSDDSDLALA
eukprot:gb/GEZN01001728.1/.p1 GENE.gb/GEZN01001728.1/~~gb/GEZN01001728.1/.p1  ORF type:complete len:826 (-),score=151.72 gb/GEZN01001728.1/:316-2793(-)